MDEILLSVCCAPCATVAIEELSKEFEVTLHFWGNNLDTAQEYQKRLNAVNQLAQSLGLTMIVEKYKPIQPEDCSQCFELRLSATAGLGFPYFATALTTSPHKDADVINTIGSRFDGYVATNFKKNNGFTRSVELSKKQGLYRQNYCGCNRSLQDARLKQ